MEQKPLSPTPEQIEQERSRKELEEFEALERLENEILSTTDLELQKKEQLEKIKTTAEKNLPAPITHKNIAAIHLTDAQEQAEWERISNLTNPVEKTDSLKALAKKTTAAHSLAQKKPTPTHAEIMAKIDTDIENWLTLRRKRDAPPTDPPSPKPDPAIPLPTPEKIKLESQQKLQKETQRLQDAVCEKRNAYASADQAISGSWIKIKRLFNIKEQPDEGVLKMKKDYQEALKKYADFQLEKIANIPNEAERKRAMHELYLEISATEATNLLDTRWNMKAEEMRKKNDVTTKTITAITKFGEKWRKMGWKTKLATSAVIFGMGVIGTAWGPATVIAGIAGLTVRGLGTLATYKGSEQFMESLARKHQRSQAENKIKKEQKDVDWFENLAEKLDEKIATVDVRLRELEKGQTIRKGIAIGFASFVASGIPGRLINASANHGWLKAPIDWIKEHTFWQPHPDVMPPSTSAPNLSHPDLAQNNPPDLHKPTSNIIPDSTSQKLAGKPNFTEHFSGESSVTPEINSSHGGLSPQKPSGLSAENLNAPKIARADYLTATNGVETALKGDSAWKMIGRQLEARYGEKFASLNPEQKTYVIDHLKNLVQKKPGDFGLLDADKIKLGQKIDLSKLFENNSSVKTIFAKAGNLSPSQLENIAKNNKTILSFLAKNKGVFLNSDLISKLLKK